MSLEVWTLEPKGEAQCHKIDLPSLEALCYTIGSKDFLPFRVDDKGPFLYTYVSIENERKIIVCQNEFASDDEFWNNYIDGQTLAIPVPIIAARNIKYDDLKRLLREDESGLRYQLRTVQEKHCTATRRHKIDRRELQRAKDTAKYDGLFSKEIGVYSQAEYVAQKHVHVKQAAQDYAQGKYSAIFFMDMRKFKRINDTFGHPFGDLVLKEVGKAIKSAIRDKDPVYRAGGEEFVTVAHYLSNEDAAKSMEDKIKEKVDAIRIRNPFYDPSALKPDGFKVFEPEDEFIRFRINVGHSLFYARLPEELRGWNEPQYAQEFDAIAKRADDLMYEDKNKSAGASKSTIEHIQTFMHLRKLSRTA
ncbi:diguanylate cyclase [Candidatus Woesearchaeota archaeon]|nr:diguanylate cyclase [Candidatus Woesearchaeota archaeon]